MIGVLVGQGRTADIFKYGDHQVVKVFHEFCETDWIEAEINNAKVATAAKIRTPDFHEVIDVNGKVGVVYDFVEGINLGEAFKSHIGRIGTLAKDAATIHHSIHQIEGTGLSGHQSDLVHRIEGIEVLPDIFKEALIVYSKQLPQSDRMCHGDLHVENYILSEEGLVAIDWMGAYCGHPAADIARTLLMMNSPSITGEMNFIGKVVVKAILYRYNTCFKKRYFELSDIEPQLVAAFRPPVAALRLLENIPHEKEWLLNIIKNDLNL